MRWLAATTLVLTLASCGGANVSAGRIEDWVRENSGVAGKVVCKATSHHGDYWCRTPQDQRVRRLLIRVDSEGDRLTVARRCDLPKAAQGTGFDPGYDTCDYGGRLGDDGFDPDPSGAFSGFD